jgi:hypothetical protein
MENKSIYSKTARGMREAADKTKDLPKDLRKVLKAIDGKSTFQDLLNSLSGYSSASLEQAVNTLIRQDYIRQPDDVSPPFASSSPTPKPPPKQAAPASSEGGDLDFTSFVSAPAEPAVSTAAKVEAEAKARQEAEAAARKAAEEQARKEAEEKLRREAEAEAQARQAAEAKARQEAEAKARQEAEAAARKAAEEQARREAEEKLRREAEAKAKVEAEVKARQEAETKAKLEAEAQARQAAEAKARQESEEQLRREAEAKAQQEAEAKIRQEIEAEARRKAEDQARKEAEEQLRREAEAKIKLEMEAEARQKAAEMQAHKEAEEKLRREAEAKLKLEAETRARLEAEAKQAAQDAAEAQRKVAEDRTREAAEEQLRSEVEAKEKQAAQVLADQEAREYAEEQTLAASKPLAIGDTPISLPRIKKRWGRKIAQAVILALVAGVAIVHVVPFDGQLSALEKSATAQFGQPVKVGALNFWLLPTPRWRLHDVTVGDHGQIRVALVNAKTSISALFGAQAAITALDMESVKLDAEGTAWVLLGKGQTNGLGLSRVTATDVKVNVPFGILPVFNANATVGANGNWQKLELRTPGQKFSAELNAADEGASVKLSAAAYTLPLSLASADPVKPAGVVLGNFSATGMLSDKEFVVSEFSGETNGGYVSGKARLGWNPGWTLNGEASAKVLDTVAMFPALSEGGILGGSASFAMQGADPSALLRSLHAEGNFLIERGSLHGIDLSRVLRGLGGGGRTTYSTLDGKFAYRNGRTQLRSVILAADAMTASGNADITADKQLSGRFAIELKSASTTARSSVALAGTLDNPQFRH